MPREEYHVTHAHKPATTNSVGGKQAKSEQ